MSCAVIDPLDLLEDLGIQPLASPSTVTGGWSGTAIWRVATPDRIYALRVFRPDESRVCEREAAVMEQVRATGLPVPAVHARGTHNGAPYLLLDWLPGRMARIELGRRPWRARALGREFGAIQARLHQVAAPEALQAAGSWIDWPAPPPATLARRLKTTAKPDQVVIHLDYHLENVLVEEGRITGILDWTNARAGDPRADLARTYTIAGLLYGIEGLKLAIARLIVRRFTAGWWDGYRSIAGRQPDMPLFLAWAGRGMIADLEPKRSLPGLDVDERQLDAVLERVRHQTARWERLAGLE